MINLLIADDEPLVQAGIKSMLNWPEYDIHVVGTATNGSVAYDMIQEYSPEIVITDIKMPVMSGLELAQKCSQEHRSLPVFIILTSYEEFEFAKAALSYGVVDYLIKLELTPETLGDAIRRAIQKVQERSCSQQQTRPLDSIYLLREQFYTRLLLNLFESRQQFLTQAENLHLTFSYDTYLAAYVEINSSKASVVPSAEQFRLYAGSLQIASELISKYVACHVLSLDIQHFAILFFLEQEQAANYKQTVQNALSQTSSMLLNYYSVTIRASVGSPVSDPLDAASSYQDAKQIFTQTTPEFPIRFMDELSSQESLQNVFNMSLFKEDIRKAYAELDEKSLYDIFTTIIELFQDKPTHYVQALDAAGNILYMSLSLLANEDR